MCISSEQVYKTKRRHREHEKDEDNFASNLQRSEKTE